MTGMGHDVLPIVGVLGVIVLQVIGARSLQRRIAARAPFNFHIGSTLGARLLVLILAAAVAGIVGCTAAIAYSHGKASGTTIFALGAIFVAVTVALGTLKLFVRWPGSRG